MRKSPHLKKKLTHDRDFIIKITFRILYNANQFTLLQNKFDIFPFEDNMNYPSLIS